MARFKPGTFSVHFFFFLFLSRIFLFSFETCLSYWLLLSAFLLAASQARLLFSFCLFLLLLLPCRAAADMRIPPHKSNQSLTLRALHTGKGCLWVSATRHREQPGAKSSHSGRALTLQTAWIHSTCFLRSGGFLTNCTGKALLKTSLLL